MKAASIYDTDEPLTLLGRPWSAWSMVGPMVLGWPLVLLAGMALMAAHLHPAWEVLLIGLPLSLVPAALGALLGTAPAAEHHHKAPAVYLALSGLFAGWWLTFAAVVGVWPLPMWICWALLWLVGSGTWPSTRHAQLNHERKIKEAKRARLQVVPAEKPRTRVQMWEAAFAEGGALGVTVYGAQKEPEQVTRAGFMLHIGLPADGKLTFDRLNGMKATFEVVFGHVLKGLRPGALRLVRARNSYGQLLTTEVYVYVDVRDVLAENIPLPEDSRPLSVYDAFTVGVFIDGSPMNLPLHAIHQLVSGQTRKGKSNFYHVLISLLTRCYDVVLWLYDGKGGATVWPWIEPYLNREIDPATGQPLDRCVIDWPAIDRFEAERMLLAGVAAAVARPGIRRQAQYADANGGDKWQASAEYPAIFILIDEASEAVGGHTGPAYGSTMDGATALELAKLATRGVVLGAGEMVLYSLAAQRATVDMIGNGTTKSQLGGRISFPLGGGASEASEVFQGDPEATQMAAGLTHPGSCVVAGYGYDYPQPGKTYLVGEKQGLVKNIRRMAISHASMCGQLDEGTAAAIEQYGYSTVWTDELRTYWMRNQAMPAGLKRYNAEPQDNSGPAVADGMRAGGATATALLGLSGYANPFAPQPERPAPPTPAPAGDDPLWRQFEQQYQADMAEMTERGRAVLDDHQAQMAAPEPAGPPVPTQPEPTAFERFVQIIRESGTYGITVSEAYRKLGELAPKTPKTLYTWRDKATRDGLIVAPASGYNSRLYSPEGWSSQSRRAA